MWTPATPCGGRRLGAAIPKFVIMSDWLRAEATHTHVTGVFEKPARVSAGPPREESVPPTRLRAGGKPRNLRYIKPGATSLVVRNIPVECSLRELLAQWGGASVDFLYFPYNMKAERRLGFCFINFVTHEAAKAFQRMWSGRALLGRSGKKKLDIDVAHCQGIAENLELLRGKDAELMTDPDLLPAVFVGGRRVDTREFLVALGIITPPRWLVRCS